MAVTWERFCGRQDEFAIRLSFMPDPDDGLAADPDESASWGALQIWVNGQNLCAHVDQGETLQGAHWYLLPFLEWVVDSWNPLLHEERLPNRNLGETAVESLDRTRFAPPLVTGIQAVAWEQEWFEWQQRHSLRAARNGGLLPNVVIRRLRDEVEVSWNDEPLAGAPRGFQFSATSGTAAIAPAAIAIPLNEAVSESVTHLLTLNPHSSRLQKLKSRLATLSSPAESEARLSWLAGVQASDGEAANETAGYTAAVRSAWQRIRKTLEGIDLGAAKAALTPMSREDPLVIEGSCQAALLFGSVAPNISTPDIFALSETLINQYDKSGTRYASLIAFSDEVPLDSSSQAWEQGYELAEVLHEENDIIDTFVNVEEFAGRLGIEITHIQLEDQAIRACSLVGPQHKPTIALNDSYFHGSAQSTLRFSVAHELCHLLYDRSRGQQVALASGPWAPVGIEKRANAFAAMFLMPPKALQSAIFASPYAVNERRGILFICDRLKVNFRTAVDHLYNLTFMTELERDKLLSASNDSSN